MDVEIEGPEVLSEILEIFLNISEIFPKFPVKFPGLQSLSGLCVLLLHDEGVRV